MISKEHGKVRKKYKEAEYQSGVETQAVRGCYLPGKEIAAQSPPIYLTSGFHYESAAYTDDLYAGRIDVYEYSRTENPTTRIFEDRMALLEHGDAGLATSSGMQAIFLSLFALLKAGDHVVCSKVAYGNTVKLVSKTFTKFGISATFADINNLDEWEDKIQQNTKVFIVETPVNPTIELVDLESICKIAKRHNIVTIVDNTFLTPIGQRPLDFGADVVVHSTTKYIDGQGRSIGGIIIGGKDFINNVRSEYLSATGGCISPFNSWILLKSLETLPLRMKQHSENALKVAQFLEHHPNVDSVMYPFLSSHPQYVLAKKQQKLGGGMLAFCIKGGATEADKVVDAVKMISLIGNLGDTQTTISNPARSIHMSVTLKQRKEMGITPNLLRLSVGLENANDIIADLDQALKLI